MIKKGHARLSVYRTLGQKKENRIEDFGSRHVSRARSLDNEQWLRVRDDRGGGVGQSMNVIRGWNGVSRMVVKEIPWIEDEQEDEEKRSRAVRKQMRGRRWTIKIPWQLNKKDNLTDFQSFFFFNAFIDKLTQLTFRFGFVRWKNVEGEVGLRQDGGLVRMMMRGRVQDGGGRDVLNVTLVVVILMLMFGESKG